MNIFQFILFLNILIILKKKIIQLYKENKYISKVINDFSFVDNLYGHLIYLCNNYDKNSLDKYINLLNNFIINGNSILINSYNKKYNLSNKKIKEILNVILIYNKQNYSEESEDVEQKESKDNYFLEIKERAEIDFFLLDKKLCEYILLDIFQRKKEDLLSLKILFSFKYDFIEYIDSYQEQVINIIKNNEYEFTKYLLNSPIFEKNDSSLESKLIISLATLLEKNNMKLSLFKKDNNYSKKNFLKLCFLFYSDYNDFYNEILNKINSFISSFKNFILKKWDMPINKFNFDDEFVNNINLYCKFLIESVKTREKKIKIIQFFFEDFLFLLNPKLKEKLEFHKFFCLEYLLSIENENIVVEEEDNQKIANNCGKNINEENKNEKNLDFYNYEKDLDLNTHFEKKYYLNLKDKQVKILNHLCQSKRKYLFYRRAAYDRIKDRIKKYLYFIMIIVNINIKYGDYNPELLFNICLKFNLFEEAFLYYINILHENLNKKEVIREFFLTKDISEKSLDLKLKDYIISNLPKIRNHNHSFLIFFFIDVQKKLDKLDLKDYYYLIPPLKLNYIPENIPKFINSMIYNVKNKKLNLWDFLTEDYKLITEESIKRILNLIKYISKYYCDKYEKIIINDKIIYIFYCFNKIITEKDK